MAGIRQRFHKFMQDESTNTKRISGRNYFGQNYTLFTYFLRQFPNLSPSLCHAKVPAKTHLIPRKTLIPLSASPLTARRIITTHKIPKKSSHDGGKKPKDIFFFFAPYLFLVPYIPQFKGYLTQGIFLFFFKKSPLLLHSKQVPTNDRIGKKKSSVPTFERLKPFFYLSAKRRRRHSYARRQSDGSSQGAPHPPKKVRGGSLNCCCPK